MSTEGGACNMHGKYEKWRKHSRQKFWEEKTTEEIWVFMLNLQEVKYQGR
jgi:hypothetical protein